MESLPSTMKALLKSEPQSSYVLVDLPVPRPQKGQTLIKIGKKKIFGIFSKGLEKVGICGSDIGLYKWDAIGQSIATLPFTPVQFFLTSTQTVSLVQGHEAVGIVVENGEDVVGRDDIPVGTRVCVENHYYCGECYQCTHDLPHICQAMGQFGHGMGICIIIIRIIR